MTTWMSRHQKGRAVQDFYEARDDGLTVASAGHMQVICTSLQTDDHASTSPLSFYKPDALPDMHDQQYQNTEGNRMLICSFVNISFRPQGCGLC